VILGAVIEKITGQTLEKVLQEKVFGPIGMHDTLLRRWDDGFVPNSASSHTMDESGRYRRTEYCGGVDYAGAGAIVSTVDDMLRWMAHMDSPTTGTSETWRLMKTPQVLTNTLSTGYGMGLESVAYRGIQTLQHSGGGFGSNAQMLKVPSLGLDVTVMVNRSDHLAVNYVNRILDVCLTGLDPAPEFGEVRPTTKPIYGVFRSPTSGRVVQLRVHEDNSYIEYSFKKGGQLLSVNGFLIPVVADDQGILRPTGLWTGEDLAARVLGDPTRPTGMQLSEQGHVDELVPLKLAKNPTVENIEGRYRFEGMSAEALIRQTAQGPQMDVVSRLGSAVHRLECIAEGIWWTRAVNPWVKPPWGLISFDAGDGAFRFSNSLNRNVRFQRIG